MPKYFKIKKDSKIFEVPSLSWFQSIIEQVKGLQGKDKEIEADVADIAKEYLKKTDASNTYLSKSAASSEYATKTGVTEAINNIEIGGVNLVTNSAGSFDAVTREYIRTVDLAPYIDEHGLDRPYALSFDAKADKDGLVNVYMQNGSGTRYSLERYSSDYPSTTSVPFTTDWKRYKFVVKFTKSDENETGACLAFYGIYGTGVFPHVRNIKLELGNKCTDWTPAPEDIETKISEEYTSKTELAEAVDGIETDIAKAVDGIKVGGRNLLKGTGTPQELRSNSNVAWPITTEILDDAGTPFIRARRSEFENRPDALSTYTQISPDRLIENIKGKTVTCSFYARSSVDTTGTMQATFVFSDDSYLDIPKTEIKLTPEWNQFSRTVELPDNGLDIKFIRINPYQTNIPEGYQDGSFYLDYRNVKLEFGNKCTDWTPCPNDTLDDISNLDTTLNETISKVESIKIGGRNLLKNSGVTKANAEYQLAQYELVSAPSVGDECVLTVWGELGSDRTGFMAYNSGGSVKLGNLSKKSEGIYQARFSWINRSGGSGIEVTPTFISIYVTPSNGTSESTINRIKLEKGTIGTDWTPAPEDIDSSVSKLENTTSGLSTSITNLTSTVDSLSDTVDALHENDLEKQIITHYLAQRDGRIYSTKLWKVSANPTNVGIKLDSNADLVCEPSTDTVEGRDDYANIPLFQWSHCNFKVDENGKKIPTVLEGAADYKTTGDAEVGTIFMTPYYRVQEFDDYYIWSISDTKHEGFIEPLDAQGKPYIVVSTYTNSTATDGMLRSQPGLRPKAFTSANSLNQDIKKKGWSDGGTNDYILIAYLMNVIKYGNKNSQVTMKGCVNYNWQYNPAEKSSVAGNTFTVTKAEGNNILLGSMVQLGYQNPTSDSTDRGNATMYELGFRQVLAIEPGEETTVITLDGEPFVTADKVSGEKSYPLYMSSYFWKTGTTDKVIGHHDGSYISNTNEKYPCRIHGIELMLGCWEVTTDVAVTLNAQNERNLYRRPLGTAFTTSQATVESTYDYVGKYHQYGDTTDDYWIGDVIPMSDTLVSVDDTSTHTYGVGDRFYYGGTATSGAREVLSFGNLWHGSVAGFACVYLWFALTAGHWSFAGRS